MKRSDLELLFGAGIVSARFSARAAGISPRGFVVLEDVCSPAGESEYCWVDPRCCPETPPVGAMADFLADITPYTRDNGSCDFTLTNIRQLEVL